MAVLGGHRCGDELGLAAGPVRRHDQAAGDHVGDRRAVVAADQMQAQVHRGGLARRREHAAVVDVEHVRVDRHPGIARGQFLGVGPVRGRAPPVQQAGGGEHERARAQGDHPRARLVGRAHRVDQVGRRVLVDVGQGGDDHGVGVRQPVEPAVRLQQEPADPDGARGRRP